jgi:uncharacterized membrane protein YfcA
VTAPLAGIVAVLVSAVVKGAIGFGFPTLGTPLLALFVDVKTAVVLLILPNIVMDAIQASRRGGLLATARRFTVLVLFGAVGTIVGTRLLAVLSVRTATLVLGITVVAFVALNVTRWSLRVSPAVARWLDAPVGFVAGVVGGVTNVPGTPLVIYYYALGLTKPDFVRAVAVTFVLYKVVQLGAVTWYGLLTWRLLGLSLLLTAVALVGFRLGLAIQDRLDQATFNRAILVFLALLGAWLCVRAVM